MIECLVSLLALLFFALMACTQFYGAYLSFKKKWYMGAVALFVPGFALIVGAAKFLFKKDLLE